jgi:hypothetical protein
MRAKMTVKPVRRKWDHEHRTTRWAAIAKVGTQPYGLVYFDKKPVAGDTRFMWALDRGISKYVVIDRIEYDRVFCSFR